MALRHATDCVGIGLAKDNVNIGGSEAQTPGTKTIGIACR